MKKKKPLWTKLALSESKDSHWEAIFSKDDVTLVYIPKDDYSKKDKRISMPKEHFEELLKLAKHLSRKS